MKLALAWIAVLVVSVVGSCSVNHRSGDYACVKPTDCTAPRTCDNGFCVVPEGTPVDAPHGTTDGTPQHDAKVNPDAPANVCPSQCTSCDLQTHACKIECNSTGNCAGPVQCPSGFDCTVVCGASNSCRNGVTCADTNSCTVICSGQSTCRNVTCGTGRCDVQCSGPGSCRGISCGNSCACDVTCGSNSFCDTVTCSGLACNDVGTNGCTSQNPGCNTCP